MEPETAEEPQAEEDAAGRDPMEWLRLTILGLGLALNFYVLWDQYRDHPDVVVMRRRLAAWWDRNISEPRRAARSLRRDSGKVVFEAIQIVEGTV